MSPKVELVKKWLTLAEKAVETARSIYEFTLKSLPDLEKLLQE